MTLYELLRAIAFRIADARQGAAGGGSTTTLLAANLNEPSGYWNDGSLFIDLVPPVIVSIAGWNGATKTFTFEAQSGAITAGTTFTVISQKYPPDILRRAVWQAFHDIGYRMALDETLTTQSGSLSYDIPGGREDIRRVEILRPNGTGEIVYNWRVLENKLVFDKQPAADRTIRLHYVRAPQVPSGLSDALDPLVNPELLTVVACMHALMWRNYKVGRDEPNTSELLNYYVQTAMAMNYLRPQLLPRDPILARY